MESKNTDNTNLKITDFGFAKCYDPQEGGLTETLGSPLYMAPEIIDDLGHSYPIDWWALGVLIYEMMVGFCPFYTGQNNDNNAKMFKSIRTKKPFFPDAKKHGIEMSEECKDFISKCLEKKQEDRLGTKGGVKEIISHPWLPLGTPYS